MKTSFFIIFFLLTVSVYSQDCDPLPLTFTNFRGSDGNMYGVNTPVTLSPSQFPQTTFNMQFTWGSLSKVIEGLNMNTNGICTPRRWPNYNDYYLDDDPLFTPDKRINLIIMAQNIEFPWYAQSFTYEPTQLIGTKGEFQERTDEYAHSVWGFQSRSSYNSVVKEEYPTGSSKYKYKLELQKGQFPAYWTEVLWDSWPSDQFRRYDKSTFTCTNGSITDVNEKIKIYLKNYVCDNKIRAGSSNSPFPIIH